VLGFTPELSSCALCHTPLRDADDATFSHAAGGIVCPSCSRLAPAGRRLPSGARTTIRSWLEEEVPPGGAVRGDAPLHLGENEGRSHQRLLREFIGAHVGDDRPLRAFAVWEHDRWSAA